MKLYYEHTYELICELVLTHLDCKNLFCGAVHKDHSLNYPDPTGAVLMVVPMERSLQAMKCLPNSSWSSLYTVK